MDVWSLVIGAILGVFATEVFKALKKVYFREIRYRKSTKSLDHIDFAPEPGFRYFDHAMPRYKKGNLTTKLLDDRLIIPIPEVHTEFFDGKGFQVRSMTSSAWADQLRKTFEHLEVEDYEAFLASCAEEVAQQIKSDIEGGLQRFNGEMLGVKKIRLQRVGEDEESLLELLFYKTDFFTFRVFAKAYEKLKHKMILGRENGVEQLNTYFTPFLCSFGLTNFLIIDDGKENRVLFGKRSNNVAVDKNKIHFSMNEAFSLKDVDIREKVPRLSLETCLKRGLTEELGISSKIQDHHLEEFGFMSLAMDLNRFEIGISSYAILTLDKNFTLNDLKRAYQSAQDGELETDRMNLIPISELEKYVKKNYSNMSVSARNVINTVIARYNTGYLKSR